MQTDRPMTIEDLEQALSMLVIDYVSSLSTVQPQSVDRVRLEASGEYVTVMYDRQAPDGMPVLNVQIRQPERRP